MKLHWCAVALGTFLIAGCDAGNITAPTSRPFSIRVGETIAVRGADFSVKLVSVANDSRCPPGAPCCAGCFGNAEIHLEVLRNGETTPLDLNTRTDPTTGTVAVYAVEVAGLEPPRPLAGDISQGDYRVTLVVIPPDQGLPAAVRRSH